MPGFLPITDLGRGVFPGMVSDVLYHPCLECVSTLLQVRLSKVKKIA